MGHGALYIYISLEPWDLNHTNANSVRDKIVYSCGYGWYYRRWKTAKNSKVRAQLGGGILFTSNKEEMRLALAVFNAEKNKYRDKRY